MVKPIENKPFPSVSDTLITQALIIGFVVHKSSNRESGDWWAWNYIVTHEVQDIPLDRTIAVDLHRVVRNNYGRIFIATFDDGRSIDLVVLAQNGQNPSNTT